MKTKEHFLIYNAKVRNYLRNKDIFGDNSKFINVKGE